MDKRTIDRVATIRAFLLKYEDHRLIGSPEDAHKLTELIVELSSKLNKLPSRFWPNDLVNLVFGEQILRNCEITKVHFDEGKVTYDVAISGFVKDNTLENGEEERLWVTRLHNIDSAFVTEPS